MVVRTTSSPSSSPVTITVSSGSGGNRSKGLTSPIQRPSFSNSSPISAKSRRASLSRDETEVVNLNSPVDFLAYRVDLPPTPEHTFVHSSVSATRTSVNGDAKIDISVGGSEISKTIFTGRFDCKARGRVMERSTEGTEVKKKSELVCGMEGCDEVIGKGNVKCECGFRICMGCYRDCVANDGGRCPGCKEFLSKDNDAADDYSEEDEEEADDKALPLPSLRETKLEKRLSVVRSFRGYAANDFDNARWLYETQGTYGYGNAHWPKDMNESDSSADWIKDFGKKCQRPLTRKISVSTAIISPYRLLILIRLVALTLFLTWRIKNPNPEAIWLSFLSIACEIWFAFSWLLDQLPKLCPVNRVADTSLLKELFESPSNNNPRGLSDLPGIDVFVSTADPEKEPPLVTANTVLSILATDYPVEKIACYISDDGGSLLTFEALAEAATFAKLWVPFCRKHQIEPRNPEAYFGQKGDFLKNKVRRDFVQDRKRVKRQYDEFKVTINGLPESIRRRSDAFNVRDELLAKKRYEEIEPEEPTKILKATWMEDGFHWPGNWSSPCADHARGDHAGIIQTMLLPASGELVFGTAPPEGPESEKSKSIDTTGVDIRLPMLVYVSREKRPGYDHNKKAGAMNALVRASAVLSNGPFILNLDCDHYIYNSQAIREGMCFMLDRGGDRICYVQFPQRFEGIDPNDRYANHNTVFFDVNMKSLDGLQGPMYVGTGCIFRRTALYGFSPPRTTEHHGWFGTRKLKLLLKKPKEQNKKQEDQIALRIDDGQNNDDDCDASDIESLVQSRRFGNSTLLVESIPVAEYQGRLLNGIHNYKGYQGRPAGSLAVHPQPMDSSAVAEAINVISCSFEDRTEWGKRVGWIYGSVTEDVVTGYRMHNRGWRSVYCVTKRDAFRGTAPINLTDRLHQVLRWATGSVEIFFSRNNALFATRRMKFLQRVAYFNVGMYPFTSIFLVLYCFLPAVSLFTGHFIVQSLNVTFLLLLLIITITLCVLSLLEIRWSGITLHDWWRNEQFWLIGGTSAHPVAVLQGLLKVLAGVEISFTLTSKSAVDEDDEFAELYEFKWTSLMYLPITIIMVNLIAITVGVSRTVYSIFPQWSKLLGGVFFSLWVLTHLYPFAKGLMGRRGKIPTIIFLWSGLISIIFSMFWVYGFSGDQTFWKFQFP